MHTRAVRYALSTRRGVLLEIHIQQYQINVFGGYSFGAIFWAGVTKQLLPDRALFAFYRLVGGVHHLTGGGKKEGRVTCATLLALCNGDAVDLQVDDGSSLVLKAGKAPVINGVAEARMRVGCGSATIGMFAAQWHNLVDEVVIVDDHITGVMSEHQAGKVIGWPASGIKILGRRSTPGRYFQVAEPGTGWGGTNLNDPLAILGPFDPKIATPGQSLSAKTLLRRLDW